MGRSVRFLALAALALLLCASSASARFSLDESFRDAGGGAVRGKWFSGRRSLRDAAGDDADAIEDALYTSLPPLYVDVAVEGFGPAGSTFADQYLSAVPGAKVLVYDADDELGGNCNTEPIPPSDIPPGAPVSWQEIGTAAFENSALLNAIAMGAFGFPDPLYLIDAVAYANSVVPGIVQFFNPAQGPAQANYLYNFADPNATSPFPFFQYGLQTPTPEGLQAFGAALASYLQNVLLPYPYVNNYAWVDPLPPVLLQPFAQTMQQFGLQALDPLFTALCVGMLDYKNNLTMYVAAEVPLALVGIIGAIPVDPSGPQLGWIMLGGCDRLYSAIADRIGRQNVLLRTTVDGVAKRKYAPGPKAIKLKLKTVEDDGSITKRIVYAKKLVIAHARTVAASASMGLDSVEVNALSGLAAPNLYALQVDIQGPAAQPGSGYQLLNYNLFGSLPNPHVEYFQRGLPYGPAASILISSEVLSYAQIAAAVDASMATLKAVGAVTNYTILAEDDHLVFGPQFSLDKLTASPNGYTLLNQLQGYRQTYSIGSEQTGSPDTVKAWDMAYRLVLRLVAERQACLAANPRKPQNC